MAVEDGPVLVTGGTGTLGRHVVRRLLAGGRRVRVMSRRPRAADDHEPYLWATADLVTGAGVATAVADVPVIVHCATRNGGKDVTATQQLVEAARRTGRSPHLVFVSIVGIEHVPLPYYRAKLAAERLVTGAELPWTILRATQFHSLVARLTTVQRRLPVTLRPSGVKFQPVDEGEVAARLAELAVSAPTAKAEEMGGPEIRSAQDLARATARALGRSRPSVPVRVPGALGRALRAGGNLTPERAVGRITFDTYLAEHVAPSGADRKH
jgi:uncharacterized protein YbjT (DUF2867 family)